MHVGVSLLSSSNNKNNEKAQKLMKILVLHSLKMQHTHCAPATASCHQLSSFGHSLFISRISFLIPLTLCSLKACVVTDGQPYPNHL
ncbi:unnamed protein product [Gadus morhua 'NCC']